MVFSFLRKYKYLIVILLSGVVVSCERASNHVELGDKFVLENNLHKAVGEYKQAIKLDENIAEVYYKLGDVYFKMDKLVEATNEFGNAIALRPDYIEAQEKLSAAFQKLGYE